MKAPEKIYMLSDHIGNVGSSWLISPVTVNDIEYTRTDAFIEKACEYLSYHLNTSKIDVNYKFEFIEKFKKYMEYNNV